MVVNKKPITVSKNRWGRNRKYSVSNTRTESWNDEEGKIIAIKVSFLRLCVIVSVLRVNKKGVT